MIFLFGMMTIATLPRVVRSNTTDCICVDIDYKPFNDDEQAELIFKLHNLMGIKTESIRKYETRRGFHIIIKPTVRFTPLELIAIQAILGSDQRREALNFKRYTDGYFLNLLFEPKKKELTKDNKKVKIKLPKG